MHITVKVLRPRRALLRVDGINHESQLVPSQFFRAPCGILADTLRRIMQFELYIACFFAVITPTSRFSNDTHCEKRFTNGARDPQHNTPFTASFYRNMFEASCAYISLFSCTEPYGTVFHRMLCSSDRSHLTGAGTVKNQQPERYQYVFVCI